MIKHYIVLILKCLKLYNYCCAAVFWKLRRRQIAEFPLGLARVDGPRRIPSSSRSPQPARFGGRRSGLL